MHGLCMLACLLELFILTVPCCHGKAALGSWKSPGILLPKSCMNPDKMALLVHETHSCKSFLESVSDQLNMWGAVYCVIVVFCLLCQRVSADMHVFMHVQRI